MYLVRSLRTFIGTNTERTAAGLNAFLSGDEYIETDTSNIYIHDGMTWRLNSGGGSPGGSDTQIQFNDDGVFGGDPGLVYDTATDILTISSALATGGLSLVNTNSPSFATAMEASWYLNNSTPDSTEFGKFVFGNNGTTAGSENGTVNLQTLLSGTMASRVFVKSDSVTFNDDGRDVDFIVKGTGGAGSGAAGILKIDAALGAVQFNANYAGDLMDFRSTGITFNEAGADIDVRIEGDTATHLLVVDAGLDAVRVGTTTAGALLDVAPTGIIFNNAEADIDFRIAGNGVTNGIFYDASVDRLGLNTNVPAFPIHSIRDGGNNSAFETYSDTAAVGAVHILRRGRGSTASPGTVQSGDTLGGFAFGGYQSGFHNPILITGAATENWTGSAHGGKISFATTVNGSTARTEKMSLQAGLVIGSPTGGDKGAGTINAVAIYDDNVLLTDYVFEPDYPLLTIDAMTAFYEVNKHLPTIPGRDEWEKDGKFSLGKLANHLWETIEVQAIYISQLNKRIARLEHGKN